MYYYGYSGGYGNTNPCCYYPSIVVDMETLTHVVIIHHMDMETVMDTVMVQQ